MLTDRQKHDIADRLALWVSASLDLHAANDLMRQSIREWLDYQTEGTFPLPDNVLALQEEFKEVNSG